MERTGTHRLSASQTHVVKTLLQDDVLFKSSLLSSGFIYPMYWAYVLSIQWCNYATDLAKENPGGRLKSGRWGESGYIIPSLPEKIQFSLLIYGFHVYRFAYLLKFVTSKSILVVPSWSFMHVPRVVKNVSCLTHMFPVEVKQGNVLPSCHSSHTYQ